MAESDLTELLREHASANSVPGAAIGILRDGEATTAFYGVADTVAGEPVTADTRFAVGSLGKSMTATAVALMADAGRLGLDDPVADLVPELLDAGWADRATIRDLLANRSGLPLSTQSEFVGWSDDDDQVLSRVVATIPAGEPLPFWSYSNAGWCLVGRALETVTGLVWEEAMAANLLGPFGMTETMFTTRPSAWPRASGHEVTGRGIAPVEHWAPRNLGPAGSTVQSTVPDLLRFAHEHLREPSLALLRDTQVEIRIHAWLDAWCLGWARFDWLGGPVWGWDGVIGGQRSVLRMVPEQRGAVVLLTNCGRGRAMYRSMFPLVMREWFGIGVPPLRLQPSAGAAGDLSRFAGVYAWPDRRWEVTAQDSHLVMAGAHGARDALPIDDRTFLIDADDPDTPTMTFGAFDGVGRPNALYQMLWGLPRV